jgi:hypothetical protein
MAETIIRPGAILPVKVRTARKQHRCERCRKPIRLGDKYAMHTLPPRRDVNESDHWWVLRTHADLGREFGIGCDEAAAYRENEERNAHA